MEEDVVVVAAEVVAVAEAEIKTQPPSVPSQTVEQVATLIVFGQDIELPGRSRGHNIGGQVDVAAGIKEACRHRNPIGQRRIDIGARQKRIRHIWNSVRCLDIQRGSRDSEAKEFW